MTDASATATSKTDAQYRAEGKSPTEVRFWSCSNCGHREWASTAEYKEWCMNPPPMRGGFWRFRAKVDPVYCQCQKRGGQNATKEEQEEYKNKKVHEYAARTMRMYKQKIWLAPGESLPNIGIMVSLLDQLGGADPVEEHDINTMPSAGEPLVVIQPPAGVSSLKPAGEDPVESDPSDPDFLFASQTGQPSETAAKVQGKIEKGGKS